MSIDASTVASLKVAALGATTAAVGAFSQGTVDIMDVSIYSYLGATGTVVTVSFASALKIFGTALSIIPAIWITIQIIGWIRSKSK